MPAKSKAARSRAAVKAHKKRRRKGAGHRAAAARRDQELEALRALAAELLSVLREVHAAMSDPVLAAKLWSVIDKAEEP